MPASYRLEGHSTILLLDKKNISAHYLTFSWAVLNLSLYCAGYTRSTVSSREEVAQVLRSQFMQGLEDHCFRFTSYKFFNVLPSQSVCLRCQSGLLEVSKLLLVIILAARFWSFCN